MAYTIAFFGTKPYDEASFNEKNKEFGFELRFFKGHLNRHNVLLTQGVDAVHLCQRYRRCRSNQNNGCQRSKTTRPSLCWL